MLTYHCSEIKQGSRRGLHTGKRIHNYEVSVVNLKFVDENRIDTSHNR